MNLRLISLGFCALLTVTLAASPPASPVSNNVNFTGEFYYSTEVSERPAMKKTPAPRYPSEMLKDSSPGRVEVAFIINEKGLPEEVQIAMATNAAFGEAAAKAVKSWRFKPGKLEGKPVRVAILQKIEFTLEN